MNLHFFSPCPRGLETVLAEELKALDAHNIDVLPGGVAFTGDWPTCYRVNLESRIATRVLWRVGMARYTSEEDIYRLAYSVTWAKWFSPEETIRVAVTARQSPLKSLEFITLRIKDGICDHFRTVSGKRPSVDTANPAIRIHTFLSKDTATLYLDTSGEALYVRGFKASTVEAPIKENLAAGIIKLTGWQPHEAFIDPMCGSGTFLLEAAQMALNIAPGLGRKFAFEAFKHLDQGAWQALKQAAQARALPKDKPLNIFGSDIDAQMVGRTRANLGAAGLANCVVLDKADLLTRQAPSSSGVLVANPPYGVRLGEAEALAEWYPNLGHALKARWSGWLCYFITADTGLLKHIRLQASRKTPLFNGPLECRLYEYKMVSGSARKTS